MGYMCTRLKPSRNRTGGVFLRSAATRTAAMTRYTTSVVAVDTSAVSRSVEQASLSRDNQDLEKVRVLVPKCFTSCDF
jgi:hypothetical protein